MDASLRRFGSTLLLLLIGSYMLVQGNLSVGIRGLKNHPIEGASAVVMAVAIAIGFSVLVVHALSRASPEIRSSDLTSLLKYGEYLAFGLFAVAAALAAFRCC